MVAAAAAELDVDAKGREARVRKNELAHREVYMAAGGGDGGAFL